MASMIIAQQSEYIWILQPNFGFGDVCYWEQEETIYNVYVTIDPLVGAASLQIVLWFVVDFYEAKVEFECHRNILTQNRIQVLK